MPKFGVERDIERMAAEEVREKKRLGRGLAALIGDNAPESMVVERARGDRKVPIELMRPNPRNPRVTFDESDLDELAASIKEKGIVQPVLVRTRQIDGFQYEIIAGERRWRAAQRVGLPDVPVIIRDVSDQEALELAIIENVQRADLSPLEEARGYDQLLREFEYTQNDLGGVIGKSRSYVANTLRLLKLPETVKAHLDSGQLTAGHARTLITADDPEALAKEIIEGGLTVRDAESLAQRPKKTEKSPAPEKDADTKALEQKLEEVLGLISVIKHKANGSGELRIKYKTVEQLDYIVTKLGVST